MIGGVINWFFTTTIGKWLAGALVALILLGAVAVRYYLRGKSAARGEAIEAVLKNVAAGVKARIEERMNPSDEDNDVFNRDNHHRDRR